MFCWLSPEDHRQQINNKSRFKKDKPDPFYDDIFFYFMNVHVSLVIFWLICQYVWILTFLWDQVEVKKIYFTYFPCQISNPLILPVFLSKISFQFAIPLISIHFTQLLSCFPAKPDSILRNDRPLNLSEVRKKQLQSCSTPRLIYSVFCWTEFWTFAAEVSVLAAAWWHRTVNSGSQRTFHLFLKLKCIHIRQKH